MFRKRRADELRVTAGTYHPGQGLKSELNEGDSVDLRIDDERVLIKNVKRIAPGKYRGTIYGFEPSFALEYEGLKMEEEVEFEEAHIFGVNGP